MLLNENYHLEHHLFPEIPSYNLPRLRTLIRSRLPHTIEAVSYTRFLAGFVRRSLRGDESVLGFRRHDPAKGAALDISAEPSAGCQSLLARSARRRA